ncbi:hypothetical protein ZOSMA_105G00020 [Zostera marina]|uniref:Uncharacterized protein n=1 Tax=Zostera marina TaxID=29655 RepID=A0A0K9Q644_ZOSMR|nr:hypothetical protein ZOSMA_105G00020 [Zostera marina]
MEKMGDVRRNNSFHFPWESKGQDKLVVGLSSWKVHTFAALKSIENDVKQIVLKVVME